MRKMWLSLSAVGLLTLALAGDVLGGVEVGSPAPEFCLPASQSEKVCLKDFKGKDNVLLLFYVLDFTPG